MDIPRQFPRRDCIFHYAFVKVHTAEDKISLTLSSRPFRLCSAIRLIYVLFDWIVIIPENENFVKAKINKTLFYKNTTCNTVFSKLIYYNLFGIIILVFVTLE